MTDAWDELRRELGPMVGAEFLRRLRATQNDEVSLHVARSRWITVRAWVEPPEPIPLTQCLDRAHNADDVTA